MKSEKGESNQVKNRWVESNLKQVGQIKSKTGESNQVENRCQNRTADADDVGIVEDLMQQWESSWWSDTVLAVIVTVTETRGAVDIDIGVAYSKPCLGRIRCNGAVQGVPGDVICIRGFLSESVLFVWSCR